MIIRFITVQPVLPDSVYCNRNTDCVSTMAIVSFPVFHKTIPFGKILYGITIPDRF